MQSSFLNVKTLAGALCQEQQCLQLVLTLLSTSECLWPLLQMRSMRHLHCTLGRILGRSILYFFTRCHYPLTWCPTWAFPLAHWRTGRGSSPFWFFLVGMWCLWAILKLANTNSPTRRRVARDSGKKGDGRQVFFFSGEGLSLDHGRSVFESLCFHPTPFCRS